VSNRHAQGQGRQICRGGYIRWRGKRYADKALAPHAGDYASVREIDGRVEIQHEALGGWVQLKPAVGA
jgi:hypothetical protein